MNKEQKELITQFNSGKNIFLTGSAGTGKSFAGKKLFEYCETNDIPLFKSASTGIAAVNISGLTIHSLLCLGTGDGEVKNIVSNIKRNKVINGRVSRMRHLFVDEISMIDGRLLDKVDQVLRIVKRRNAPFGGVQVIFCGDFYQLPPVSRVGAPQLAFESKAWDLANFVTINLKEQVRQSSDKEFADILNKVRIGSADGISALDSRVNAMVPDSKTKPIYIFSRNIDVEDLNNQKLKEIKSPSFHYTCIDSGSESGIASLDKFCSTPKELELKVGAQVMLTRNVDVESGLVNGSIGIVTKLAKFSVSVNFDGNDIILGKEKWEITEPAEDKNGKTINKVIASREQYPVKLAYASTIHKAQGCTFDKMVLDTQGVWEYGQTYVGLSRGRSLNGLFLRNFSAKTIKANPKVKDFYKQFE